MVMRTGFRLVSVLVWTAVVAVTAASEGATESATGASGGISATGASTSAKATVQGDPAVWILAPDQSLQRSSTKFTALVERLGCNNWVTGQVLAPAIQMGESEIVVTFSVAPKQPGPAQCPSNDQVSYQVDLGEPLQGRVLVDGQCLAGRKAAGTAACAKSATSTADTPAGSVESGSGDAGSWCASAAGKHLGWSLRYSKASTMAGVKAWRAEQARVQGIQEKIEARFPVLASQRPTDPLGVCLFIHAGRPIPQPSGANITADGTRAFVTPDGIYMEDAIGPQSTLLEEMKSIQ